MGVVFLLLVFLGFSALFSGAEIAFVSANKLKVELRKKKGSRRGELMASFFENPNDFLGTMLVGNNISLVVFTYLMTRLVNPYIEHFFQNDLVLLLFNTSLITIIILVFGEFLPKTLFRLYADDILYFLTYPLRFLQIVLWLPAQIMTGLSEFILNKVFKGRIHADNPLLPD